MSRNARLFLTFVGVFQLVITGCLLLGVPAVTQLWPLEGTTRLSFILLASLLAGAAGATLWVAAVKDRGALKGIGLQYITILGPLGVLFFQLGSAGVPGMGLLTIGGFLSFLFGLGLLAWSWRTPIPAEPPVPPLVHWSLAAFVIALLIAGVRMIFKAPNILPWSITPQLSAVFGWAFTGALAYFLYGFLRPSWRNAGGQLAGFLAYDLVLIIPFIQHFGNVVPDQRVSLIIYTVVVVYSGALGIYYLFIHPSTRLGA